VTLPLVLRPPGALPEDEFLSACSRCGKCVEACPAECIVLTPDAGGGAPHIIAEKKACVVCDSLACMNVCPTGALQIVPRFAIRMGRAVWGEGKCLRGDGQDCRICVDACPMGTAALDISEVGKVEVKEACTGCGTCQYVCPTTPRAIVVVPHKL
jgi:ferredoxin-type protein NapG